MKASIKLLVVSILFAGFLTISRNSVAAINDPCRQACDDQYASCLIAPQEQYDICSSNAENDYQDCITNAWDAHRECYDNCGTGGGGGACFAGCDNVLNSQAAQCDEANIRAQDNCDFQKRDADDACGNQHNFCIAGCPPL